MDDVLFKVHLDIKNRGPTERTGKPSIKVQIQAFRTQHPQWGKNNHKVSQRVGVESLSLT